jgi:hypothetical protein
MPVQLRSGDMREWWNMLSVKLAMIAERFRKAD